MVIFLSIIILISSAYIIAILADPSGIALLTETCSGPSMCWTLHIRYIIDSKSLSFIFPVTLVLVFNVLVIFPFCRKMGLTIRPIFHHQICDLLSALLVSKDPPVSADPLPVEAMLLFAVQLQRAFCPPPLWYFFTDCIFSGT